MFSRYSQIFYLNFDHYSVYLNALLEKYLKSLYVKLHAYLIFTFRRWGFMVPWIIVYGVNILGYFAGAIIMFYQLAGPWKALGMLPLTVGCFLLVGHFSVLFFCVEQRSDYLSGACNNLVDGSGASSPS